MSTKFRYEEFTWPEIRVAVEQNRVAVVPVGTVEQHGPHLPLGTDAVAATELSRLAVKRVPEEAVVLPPVYYSSSERHMDFPGTIAVEGPAVTAYLTGIGRSLARHGFRKILLVDGHGGNAPSLEIAAANVTNGTESLCALVSWWSLIPPHLMRELRQSQYPGGMAHACELETSVMLYLRGDLVQMNRAEKDIGFEPSEYFCADLHSPSPVVLQEPFSRYSRTGAVGDPAQASSEKGRRFVEAVVERLVALLKEFRAREIRPSVDHH